LTFSPNIKFHTGLGFYLFEIGFQFIVAIPRSQSNINEFGESNSLDLQANLIGKNWGLDLFHESYQGYYVEDTYAPLASGIPKPQRRDIETTNAGVSAFYFFNKQRYSVRSIYNFYERQLKSAGSTLVALNYSQFSLRADSLIYSLSQKLTLGNRGDFNRMNYRTLAVAGGYGYNLVLKKNWFIGTNVSAGPVFQWFNYADADQEKTVFEVRPYLNWRATIGLNSERIFAGLTYSFQTVDVDYENIHLSSRNGTFRLAFGYRFKEVGILKKRASEFIKPKRR
jgi:hypothetical protein